MGTNYYVVRNRQTIDDPIHIGKASIGWMFHFQAQNDKWNDPPVVWNTYPQVKKWLYDNTVASTDFVIMDEYDEIIPYEELIELIDDKQTDPFCRDTRGTWTVTDFQMRSLADAENSNHV